MKQNGKKKGTKGSRQVHPVITLLLAVFILAIGAKTLMAEQRININKADARELQKLPYIGRQRAIAIVHSRESIGPFRSLKELVTRKLIGEETLRAIENQITIYATASPPVYQPINITNIHIDGSKGEIFLLENQNYVRVLTAKIIEAKSSIRIVTFLFKTSANPHNYATQLLEKLGQAVRRGVDVEIVLELSDYNLSLNEDNRFTLERLKEEGVKVRFDDIGKQTHTKLAIIDGRFTFIGSHNLSHSALYINNELSLMIDSEKTAEKALAYFRSIE